MRKALGVGLVLAALISGLFASSAMSSSASSQSSYVEPIRWDLLDNGLPTDDASGLARDVLLNATRHSLTTWYPETYGSQTGQYLDLGGIAESNIRPPSDAVMSLAIVLGTDAYDPDRTGVPTDEARAVAVKLLTSIAYRHIANSPDDGWGDCQGGGHCQTALWAAGAATAGWLLWDDLTDEDRSLIERMVTFEADRFLDYEVPYYQLPDGTVAYPGDTKAEENAWDANFLNLASTMLPEHPNQPVWQHKAIELMVSSYSRQSDLSNDTVVNGKPVSEWLNGSNIFEDGTLVNHNLLHPDYMTSVTQMTSAPLLYSLAGKPTPRAALFNADLVYGALTDLELASPPYDEPGGTIYLRDAEGMATSDIYYPQGNDWGTGRRMHFGLIDTEAELFGFDNQASVPASDWAAAHIGMVSEMQSRFTDGRTYGDASEDTYSGREQWVAQIAGRTYLARWLDHQDVVKFTNAEYPDSSTPDQIDLGPLETASSAMDHFNVAGWWSPMAEFNDRAYLAFNYDYLPNEAQHEVWVARRDGADDFGVRGCLPASGGGCALFPDDEGHNQPSIAIDGDGYIHVFASMHNNPWQYYRSVRPEDPTEFVNASAEMPEQDLGFTYPNLATGPDGDVWLIARSRTPGLHRAGGRLYHWNNANDSWSLVGGTAFAYQLDPERTVYPDDVQVTPDGDVHIAFEWAHDATGVRHEGSYLRYSPSENAFYTADGNQVDVPVTPSTPGLIYQPLEPGEDYGGEEGVVSAKLTMSESGSGWTPTIAYRYKDPADPAVFEVERAAFRDGQWSREQVFGGPADTHAALDVTDDGQTERIYYTTKDNGGMAYVAERPSTGGEWTHTEIADGKPVERLSILMRPDGTDWAYLAAPTVISARRGELYFRTIGR